MAPRAQFGRIFLAGIIVFGGVAPLCGHVQGVSRILCWAAIGLGVALLIRTLMVMVRLDADRLIVRNILRTDEFDVGDISSVSAVVTAVAGGRQVEAGQLVVTVRGKRIGLLATSAARPSAIVSFVEHLQREAPEAALDVDLSLFPHRRSERAGSGRIGPPPAVVSTDAETHDVLRLRQRNLRSDLDDLKSQLDQIKRDKRP